MNGPVYTLSYTEEQVNRLMNLLAQAPYIQVHDLMTVMLEAGKQFQDALFEQKHQERLSAESVDKKEDSREGRSKK